MQQDDIYKMQGELSVLKKELEELEIEGSNSLITIYSIINPLNVDESIAELELNRANVEMKHLTDTWEKTKEVKTKADKIAAVLSKIKKSVL